MFAVQTVEKLETFKAMLKKLAFGNLLNTIIPESVERSFIELF